VTTSTEPTATATPAAAATPAATSGATRAPTANLSGRERRHEAARQGSPLQIGLALFALAMGGFAIGTTEFVSMGLLPQLASGVGVSIPTAGHVISAYALGVVVGAPLIAVFGARLPRRELLIGLMAVFLVGNAASALATGFASLTAARFFAGLPHGAYFGVASLVAAGLVATERRGRAVSGVMLGLAFANVAGVPAATWLGQHAGWRSAYWLVSGLAALTALLVLWLVPHVAANRDATGRNELSAFRNPQVLLTLLAGAIGFGGMFAVYTYIAPTVTDVAGLGEGRVPLYLLAMGLGMVVGTPLGGRLADWSIFRSLLVSSVSMIAILVAFTFTSEHFLAGLTTVFLLTVAGSVLVTNLQMRLMQVAGNAQTIGAAMNHASLNIANALGAWLGGVVVAAGFGYTSTAWVGAALSLAGLLVLLASAILQRRTSRQVGRQ
jgi:MFS transporter, DHA1 family, inner membrane transport protein